jgi:hypothetical protein
MSAEQFRVAVIILAVVFLMIFYNHNRYACQIGDANGMNPYLVDTRTGMIRALGVNGWLVKYDLVAKTLATDTITVP